MIRILGVNIPEEKRIVVALTYIFGIGPTLSERVLKSAGISFDTRAKELKSDEINKIQEIIEKEYKTEGDLKREVRGNIDRLKQINSYRGSRHAKRMPARGQRTKTNSRTVRGNVRKTAGSGKRKIGLK